MRRNSKGVERLARAEHEPRFEALDDDELLRLQAFLDPLVADTRRARLRAMLDLRIESVRAVLDTPYDPHNGAAIVRSCDAFGVQNLHIFDPSDSFLAAETVARGAQKWVTLHATARLEQIFDDLRGSRHTLVAAHADGALDPEELRTVARPALVFGNERDGIGEPLLAACPLSVRIGMRGFVESLNVSVSAAILLREATRGRPGDLDRRTKNVLYVRGLYFSIPRAREVLANAPVTVPPRHGSVIERKP